MTAIVIPTYNEMENLGELCQKIFKFLPTAQIIIVDDNSTDGTPEIIKHLSEANPQITYIFRTGEKNFAGSYIDGFKKALTAGANKIIQMDADGSHNPVFLPQIEKELDNYDTVIGSRYVKGGGVRNWSLKRQLISRGGNLVASLSTRLCLNDLTSGYVGWRKEILKKIPFEKIQINGYSFQIDLKHSAHNNGAKIKEIPIIFTDRVKGESKMNVKIIKEAMLLCLKKIFFSH